MRIEGVYNPLSIWYNDLVREFIGGIAVNHVTIGVYANGDYKVNIVKPEHLEVHLEYNRTMRSGRALFLDGKCVQQGYLGDNHIAEWTERIAAMNIDTATPSKLYW